MSFLFTFNNVFINSYNQLDGKNATKTMSPKHSLYVTLYNKYK